MSARSLQPVWVPGSGVMLNIRSAVHRRWRRPRQQCLVHHLLACHALHLIGSGLCVLLMFSTRSLDVPAPLFSVTRSCLELRPMVHLRLSGHPPPRRCVRCDGRFQLLSLIKALWIAIDNIVHPTAYGLRRNFNLCLSACTDLWPHCNRRTIAPSATLA